MSQDYTMIHKTKEIYLKDINSNRASQKPHWKMLLESCTGSFIRTRTLNHYTHKSPRAGQIEKRH